MKNTTYVSQKNSDEDFLFQYITGISDGESTVSRARLETPPDRLFGAMLTMATEDVGPKTSDRIYKGLMAEGAKTPLLFCRCIGNYVLTVADDASEEMFSRLHESAAQNCGVRVFGVYETGLKGCELYGLYERLENQLSRVFYIRDREGVIRAEYGKKRDIGQFNVALEAVLKGDVKNAEAYICSLFRLIECVQPRVGCLRKYLIRMYSNMLMQNMQHNNVDMIKAVAGIQTAKTIFEAKDIILSTAKRLASMNIPESGNSYSALVRETVHIINENIGNEELSLRWIAGNILYTNVDYLGKVFKKETGKNFSHYVMEKRMEAAKRLILSGENYKIYEVAEKVGFGSNSQYFSQVFKKYTGVSPLEYKEYSKQLRQKKELAK